MRQIDWREAIAIVTWLTIGAAGAGAQVTTHDPASVLVFPKVIVDGSWETAIQLSNIANRPAYATCYYVNGQLTLPGLPPGPTNPPSWAQTDFTLSLVRQQPTEWVVSRGRVSDPKDTLCSSSDESCDGTGLDPGRVPAVSPGFTGELLCYETDASGAPWSGNALIGHATLTNVRYGEIVKYPAVGITGLDTNDADGALCLGGETRDRCALGAEYGGCPREWIVSHPADFDYSPVDGDASRTRLTIVPCEQDFATQIPQEIALQVQVFNEFEEAFSAALQVDCWGDFELGKSSPIFNRDVLGGDWAETRLRASAETPFGFTVITQTETESAWPPTLMAVAGVPHQGGDPGAGVIAVPEEGVR